MRKSTKIFLATATAAILAAGTLSIAACGPTVKGVDGLPENYETVTSNGGFVVGVGNYYYFINGIEQSTSDNTYGTPVKGSLQRILKTDLEKGENTAETVIPSLMVAGDYTAGIFVYGDRVYYATPTNTPNTQGVIENSYLDFKSAKLDGTDIVDLFRLESNTTPYRFVKPEGGDDVYVIYASANADTSSNYDLHARNTANPATDTVLAENATGYLFHNTDKGETTVYYTMGVVNHPDSDNPDTSLTYNQIYRVEADTTEAPYDYEWDWDWLEENNDGEAPYVNLGTLVVDGIGAGNAKTQYNHSDSTPVSPVGYTYSLKTFANGGIYFVRTSTSTTDSTVGASGSLYYLAEDKMGTDSIAVNDGDALETVASAASTSSTSSAFFYIEGGKHHYIYADGSNIVRADVTPETDGTVTTDKTTIARGASSPRFLVADAESHSGAGKPAGAPSELRYLYYTNSTSGGFSVNRAVYNGVTDDETGKNDYGDLTFNGEDNSYFKAVRILDVEHTSGWYDLEIVDGLVFFANAKQYGSTAYSYISVVDLKEGGSLMDNKQLAARNDKLEEITGTDGLLSSVATKASTRLRNLLEYYFYTRDKQFTLLNENIQEAEDAEVDELYDEEELNALKAFANGEGFVYDESEELFKDTDFKDGESSYRVYSYFVTNIGTHAEADDDAIDDYYKGFLEHYEPPQETEEEGGLEGWEIALIVVACVLAAGAATGVGLWLYFRKKKSDKKKAPKPVRMHVDTSEDGDIDVYATNGEEGPDEE